MGLDDMAKQTCALCGTTDDVASMQELYRPRVQGLAVYYVPWGVWVCASGNLCLMRADRADPVRAINHPASTHVGRVGSTIGLRYDNDGGRPQGPIDDDEEEYF